ncbi:MAG: CPBP family intramembrane metalloprotease [Clostridiales bacterium]|nr:CPBP family intramembrane metalloprotease [Clostridiales bacterium]
MKKEKRVLALFLILVFAISAPLEAIYIIYGEAAESFVALLMIVPAVIAVILKLVFFRKQSILGLGIGKPVYYLYAVMIPVAYIGLSYLMYWLFVPGTFIGASIIDEALSSANIMNIQSLPIAIAVTLLFTVLTNIPLTFGEEAGWRGLMYPIMHKLWGRNKALIISGGIWAAWHMPAMIGGVYMPGAHVLYQIPMFMIQILSITVVVSWLRMRSGSVWPAALCHAMHNVLDQGVFRPLTAVENSAYFISETGFITTLCAVLFAVLILVFGKFEKSNMDEQEIHSKFVEASADG